MTKVENRLAVDRASRTAARGLFDRRLSQVKADLSARGIGRRIKDKARHTGEDVLAEGLEIARDNPGVVAATGVALALWFFRKPLTGLISRLAGRGQDPVQEPDDSTADEQPE